MIRDAIRRWRTRRVPTLVVNNRLDGVTPDNWKMQQGCTVTVHATPARDDDGTELGIKGVVIRIDGPNEITLSSLR